MVIMKQIEIELRKDAFKRTILLRIVFYTLFLFSSTIILYFIDTLLNQQIIKYILSLIILISLAFFSQYLIYAKSLRKKISYNNFKDTLLENELDHPIKFIFPEFNFFYKLEDSVIDKLDSQKFDDIIDNYLIQEKTSEIKGEFKIFISSILEELLEYEIVIKMKRKGKAIFDDLVEDFQPLEKLIPFTDAAVPYNTPKIKNHKILIFDDSIHYGKSAREIIDLLKKIGYNEILFVTVISQHSALESLKKDYSEDENIFFKQYAVKEESGYKKFYAEYMIGYLDYVNKSLESDHTLIKLKIDTLIEKDDFINLFNETENYIYEVERHSEKENEYKISLECPWLYDKMEKYHFKNIKMDMVKVRFFIKLNQPNNINKRGTTDVNLSPALIPKEFGLDFCSKSKMEEICILNKLDFEPNAEIKDLICINCLIRNLTDIFIGDFMKYFRKKLMGNKANIIEESTTLPYPHEIYRLK